MGFSSIELKEFTGEAVKLLSVAKAALSEVAKGADFSVHYPALFAAFHRLKGTAGIMEMAELQADSLALETALVSIKDNSSLTPEQHSYFVAGCELLMNSLAGKEVPKLAEFPRDASVDAEIKTFENSRSPFSRHLTALPKIAAGHAVVIDDDESVAETLASIIENRGFQVTSFTDPKAAIRFIIGNDVDVIFTDVQMPEFTGLDVLQAVRKIDAHLPVIFVTGQCNRETLIEAINSGVYFVIEKPWRNEMVGDIAKKAMHMRRLNKLANSAVNTLMTQYWVYDKYLQANSKEKERAQLKTEIIKIWEQRKVLRGLV